MRGARTYRVGDKVMQLRNDYDKNVFNGDVGFVASIDPEETHAWSSVSTTGRSPSTASDLDELVLAYACTVHKSQGSEYPAVVVPLLTTHFVMLSQEPALHGRHARQAPGRARVPIRARSSIALVASAAGRSDGRRRGRANGSRLERVSDARRR